jgi:predicted nucleic acid-binding protein
MWLAWAEQDFNTRDSRQAATALASRATAFISNDRAFERLAGLEVIVRDEVLDAE